ncbi:hypothetical protein TNCT_640051 [Trichonephila clavata]|uniref:Uncharacterized protein n=1 Tax=Trichonephila clavata TaxID=2740835 RepID=A0A8X6M1K7_TRICU|nr:hypothetical protein TNCT_640051 [Trichonephila clavata]
MLLSAFDATESAIGCHCLPSFMCLFFCVDLSTCLLCCHHYTLMLYFRGRIHLFRLLFRKLDPRFRAYSSENWIPASVPTLRKLDPSSAYSSGTRIPHLRYCSGLADRNHCSDL